MRLLHRIYASIKGYYWEPCEYCGVKTGGHESHKKVFKFACKRCQGEYLEIQRRIKMEADLK